MKNFGNKLEKLKEEALEYIAEKILDSNKVATVYGVRGIVMNDDDVYDLLYNQRENIIKTHWRNGINESNVRKAIKILNK